MVKISFGIDKTFGFADAGIDKGKHRQKMTVKYSDWPIGGPQK